MHRSAGSMAFWRGGVGGMEIGTKCIYLLDSKYLDKI